jgi:hypothetical protein
LPETRAAFRAATAAYGKILPLLIADVKPNSSDPSGLPEVGACHIRLIGNARRKRKFGSANSSAVARTGALQSIAACASSHAAQQRGAGRPLRDEPQHVVSREAVDELRIQAEFAAGRGGDADCRGNDEH